MKKGRHWLILPMIVFIKYVNGTREITVGWLTKTYSIKF